MTGGAVRWLIFPLIQCAAGAAAAVDNPRPEYALEATLKHNTNLDLTPEKSDSTARGDQLGALSGRVSYNRSVGDRWRLELQGNGLANLHREHSDANWFFNRGRVSMRRRIGSGSLSLSNELRHFSEPDDDQFDFLRNIAFITYRHQLSSLWGLSLGYENNHTGYPQSSSFDYSVNGFFVEIRNRWRFGLSTYYLYDRQFYEGTAGRGRDRGTCRRGRPRDDTAGIRLAAQHPHTHRYLQLSG